MDNYEIAQSYKHAVDKRLQIKILSELTLKPKCEIINILVEEGYCEAANIPERNQGLINTNIEEYLKEWENGRTVRELSEIFNITIGCSSYIHKKYKLKANSAKKETENDKQG